MKSYSPYENVAARAYPAILATTSLNDTRVLYVEPAKWVAALRHVGAGRQGRAVLLKTEMVGRPRRGERALQGLARAGLRVRLDYFPDQRRYVCITRSRVGAARRIRGYPASE